MTTHSTAATEPRDDLHVRCKRDTEWTTLQQCVFFDYIAATGNVRLAAAEAYMDQMEACSRRRTDPAFKEQWREAVDDAYLRLETELIAEAGGTGDPKPERSAQTASSEVVRTKDVAMEAICFDCGTPKATCPTCGASIVARRGNTSVQDNDEVIAKAWDASPAGSTTADATTYAPVEADAGNTDEGNTDTNQPGAPIFFGNVLNVKLATQLMITHRKTVQGSAQDGGGAAETVGGEALIGSLMSKIKLVKKQGGRGT